ncbi:olfactory receptor 24-like [Micropterus dolomieu]|uniref:olfactory receptor 24-like n=1 Tax=Micropterus dolomieu TaxID=147949 RepID=UPI001E8D0F96|nr:olfactory receptor 24-like [Micropterus dolomieu]
MARPKTVQTPGGAPGGPVRTGSMGMGRLESFYAPWTRGRPPARSLWNLTTFHLRMVLNDSVIIHPPGFYIIGFETFPHISVYMIFLAFVYVFTLVFNILLMYIIARDHCLHTPKFLAVVNLAVIDVILNTTTIPSMIKTFVFKDNFVPFNLCLLQMYVYYSFSSLESYALAILAYDRLIAICFPLHQKSINTMRSMSCIVGMTWVYSLGRVAYSTVIMTQLSFCNSVRVFSYFCDYAPVFRLACNDYTLQWSVASTSSMVNLLTPFTFIVLSYASILTTVSRMKSVSSSIKAFSTCIEHLVLVAVFYIPTFSIFLVGLYVRSIDPDQRVMSLSLASCIPPCINPIVYSWKTKEIKTRALSLVQRMKTRP